MPDSSKIQQNFNATVYGVAGKVENQIIYASPQKQDLAEAAAGIIVRFSRKVRRSRTPLFTSIRIGKRQINPPNPPY